MKSWTCPHIDTDICTLCFDVVYVCRMYLYRVFIQFICTVYHVYMEQQVRVLDVVLQCYQSILRYYCFI